MVVTFDSLYSFTLYTTAIITKVLSCNKIFKSLAIGSWGKDKEALLATNKTISLPIINYAAPIWSPGSSRTQMNSDLGEHRTPYNYRTPYIKNVSH